MNDNAPIENPTNQPNVNTPIEAANEQPVAAPIFTSSEPAPAPAPIFVPTSTPAPAPAEPASIAQPIMSTPTATPEPTAQATPAPAPTSTPNPFLTQTAAPATPAPAAPAPETPAQNGGGCIASNRVMRDGMMIGYMYREEPIEGKPDSGWRFFAGDEDDEYNDNPDNFHIYSIGTVTEIEKDIMPFLNSPVGSAFIRDENGDIIPDDGETEISIGLREE